MVAAVAAVAAVKKVVQSVTNVIRIEEDVNVGAAAFSAFMGWNWMLLALNSFTSSKETRKPTSAVEPGPDPDPDLPQFSRESLPADCSSVFIFW